MLFHEQARAKVNLTLRVLGKRADGYHELESVVAFADVGDRLTMDLARPRGFTVAGPFAAGLDGADNLVTRALDAVVVAFPAAKLGHVTLDKQLPVAAGIGGGSADAAAVLRMARRHNSDVAQETWMRIAASLGADVPVCTLDEPAVMSGTGTDVFPLGGMPLVRSVLVNPMVEVPPNKTAAVFKRLNAAPLGAEGRSDLETTRARWAALVTPAEVIDAVEASRNDLEPPAIAVMPIIADVLAALRAAAGVRSARLSGAGPTCFGLFDDAAAATAAVAMMRQRHPAWWIVSTHVGGTLR